LQNVADAVAGVGDEGSCGFSNRQLVMEHGWTNERPIFNNVEIRGFRHDLVWCGSEKRSKAPKNCDLENCDLENCDLENCGLENCGLENC
jgi:uncharacterized protein YjbI with pentapeptide repeats